MDSVHPSPEDDDGPGFDRPVAILTDELITAMREEERLNPPRRDPNTIISPFGDESVQGYPGDETPRFEGARDILKVVKILEASNIPCCMVAEPALVYYGTERIMVEWIMCVPPEQLEEAANLFCGRPEDFEPFRPSVLTRPGGLEDLYPRFKFVGLRLFFIIMSSQACHIPCKPENIEYSQMGIPYPKLPVYAQSLLDSRNLVDLEHLIDGMNLTLEWGEDNLDLEGTIDANWGRWKADILHGGKAEENQVPMWCMNPRKRRDIWVQETSNDAKKRRQGHKYHPSYVTRFWRRGQREPSPTKTRLLLRLVKAFTTISLSMVVLACCRLNCGR